MQNILTNPGNCNTEYSDPGKSYTKYTHPGSSYTKYTELGNYYTEYTDLGHCYMFLVGYRSLLYLYAHCKTLVTAMHRYLVGLEL